MFDQVQDVVDVVGRAEDDRGSVMEAGRHEIKDRFFTGRSESASSLLKHDLLLLQYDSNGQLQHQKKPTKNFETI